MTSLIALLTCVGISLAVNTIVVLTLNRPMRLVLALRGPASNAGLCWPTTTAIMLYGAPLLFVILLPVFAATPAAMDAIRTSLAAALFGALLVIGYQVPQAWPR